MELIRRGVERGSAERVIRLGVVRVLPPASSAEHEITATARSTGSTASTESSGATAAAGSAKSLTVATATRSKALREFTGRWIELAAADRVEPIVHHPALDARPGSAS